MTGFLSLHRRLMTVLLTVGAPGLVASAQDVSPPIETSGGGETESVAPAQGDESESFWTSNPVAQYLESVFGMPEDPSQPRFIAYPVLGYAPETSWEFGVSGLLVYYAKDNPENRLSEIKAFGFVTLEQQYGLIVDHALYTDQDKWFILGEGRFQSFPLYYYGIGPDTEPKYEALVDETALLVRERVLRKVASSFYIGPEFAFDLLANVDFNWAEGADEVYPRGAEGSINMLTGLGLVYDTRHNVLNVRHGLFSELAFLHSNQAWGSDYQFSIIQSDTRAYIPVNARDTLAYQLFGNFTFGDVPFNELAALGGENLMRGYYKGRFRDRNYIGTQLEYRFLPFPFQNPIMQRFGGAVFGSAGAVFPGPGRPTADDLVYAGGAGLRFLLFPDKDIYTRADFAFTEEGPGFYLFIGEAF